MNKNTLASFFLALAGFAACGGQSASTAEKSPALSDDGVSFGVYDIASSGPSLADLFAPAAGSDETSTSQAQNTRTSPSTAAASLKRLPDPHSDSAPLARKIVRNAELSLESEQPEESQKKIAVIAQSKGGFVVESQQSSSDVRVNSRDIVQMIVRVPADKFTETVVEIRATSNRVIVETIKGEDVTEEFIDIEARLKAKKALEQQFMEIMKRAGNVEEALSVQSQLADVRGEIEKIEGRRRFLENQSSLSTIRIRMQTPAVFSANSAGFFYRLSESFGRGFDIALNFILGLVTFVVGVLPFALFIGLPGYLIVRTFIRKRSRPMSITDIAKEEIAHV